MARDLEGAPVPPLGFKLLAILLFIAIVVQSDFFADAVLSRVGGALSGGEATATGVVARAAAIGALFAGAHHMVRHDLL